MRIKDDAYILSTSPGGSSRGESDCHLLAFDSSLFCYFL